MSRFLVTGGAGFIGSHICEALFKKGHFVRVLDSLTSGKLENLNFFSCKLLKSRNCEFIKGDICDKKACLKATKGIDFVLHQAALRNVAKSMLNPQDYNEVNIGGTLNMLEAAVANKVRCFVFASSSSVYGEAREFPEKENFLPQPVSPYALTKLAGEHYCKIFSYFYGLPTVSLRYFNVFGPRQALDDEYAMVIPKFITCLLNNEPPPIHGSGRQSRDLVYVVNVAEANILAAGRVNSKGEVFNIASGRDYTVLGLAKILNWIMAKNIRPAFLNKRPGDVFKTLADLSRAKKGLGYIPKINFENGLRLTVDYFKKNA